MINVDLFRACMSLMPAAVHIDTIDLSEGGLVLTKVSSWSSRRKDAFDIGKGFKTLREGEMNDLVRELHAHGLLTTPIRVMRDTGVDDVTGDEWESLGIYIEAKLTPLIDLTKLTPVSHRPSRQDITHNARVFAQESFTVTPPDVKAFQEHYQRVNDDLAKIEERCNANPDQTCSTGLHVGAIDYINKNGFGWNHGSNRRMLLTAFWPRHVVAVPTDYAGGKMRVEQLTVLDEVDKGYVTELLSKGTLMIRGYEIDAPTDTGVEPEDDGDDIEGTEDASAKTDPNSPAGKAKVGDWIEISNDENLEDGEYLVTHVDDADNGGQRLSVKTGTADDDYEDVDDDAVDHILTEAPLWARAKVGDWVEVDNRDLPQLVIEIDDKDLYPDGSRLPDHVYVFVTDFGFEPYVAPEDGGLLLCIHPQAYQHAA